MRNLLSIALLLIFHSSLSAQQFSANVIAVDSCANYFVLDNVIPDAFAVSGTFLFINQHRGARIQTSNNANFGTANDLNGVGRYEINRISSVIGDTIFPLFKIQHSYFVSNNATSITISLPQTAAINSEQIATPYDGNNKGVLLFGSDAPIEIAADLNAAAAGHTGGRSSIRDSQCAAFTNANRYGYSASNWRGAFKGQGATLDSELIDNEAGRGPNLNGGGGGNDHNSGGGGGANITAGGNGAANEEPGFFNCKGNFPGLGGLALASRQDGSQRVYLGGGGGAGHSNNNPSRGGNGGGIIVIVAPEIIFTNTPNISVRGEDATTVNGDGGGGGGAGGTIILMTEQINGAANLDISGGSGGSVDNSAQNRCFGPGGGGSGGRLLYAGAPTSSLTINIAGGEGGESLNSQACAPGENVAENGGLGITESSVQALQTLEEVLNYPVEAIIEAPQCIGDQASIGFPNDQSCFASRWYIETADASLNDLTNDPNHNNSSSNVLDISSVPAPSVGDTLTYHLFRLNYNGDSVASVIVKVPIIRDINADFSFTTNELTVNFTNNNSSNPQWNFGDGNSSTEIAPTHNYTTSGTYEVSLTINTACGSATTTQFVTITASQPIANIGSDQTSYCSGDSIKFYNLSENSDAIIWSSDMFSLTNNSNDTVCVVLNAPGDYSINLCANNLDQQQCTSSTFTIVAQPAYVIESSINGNTFSASAIGSGATRFQWIFSNGDVLEGQSVTTTLEPGEYSVQLVASNSLCSTQSTIEDFNIVEATVPLITSTSTQGCAPFTVQFYNSTTGPIDSIRWTNEVAMPNTSSNDTLTISINETGIHRILLTVFSPNGTLTQSIDVEVLEAPQINFNINEVDGLLSTSNLSSAASNYLWNFGDGNSSNEFEPVHQYSQTGLYEVTLNALNAACSSAASRSVFVDFISNTTELDALGISIYPNPASKQLYITGAVQFYQLYDISGKQIHVSEKSPAQHTQTIDLENLANGTYVLRLQAKGKLFSYTIIKQ